MPTLEDVAKKAGVSTATVSKVLSNTPYFTEVTRAKVMQAVEEIGYVPHLAGRALSTGKTGIIAVVFPYVYDSLFTDPFVVYMLQGVEEESYAHGYNLLLSTPRLTSDGPDQQFIQLIHSGYLDGVIALDNVPLASVLEPVHKRDIACVAIGYHPTQYFIRSDDYSGGFQIMQHMLSSGHRRIGIITVPDATNFSMDHRLSGMQAAAEAIDLDFAAMPKVSGNYSIEGGMNATRVLLTEHPDLTALICLNDRMAIGAVQQARTMNRQLPDDLSIVGYDDIPTAASLVPSLTTIDQHAPELGRAAVRMLLQILDKRVVKPLTLPVHLVVRESTSFPKS
ncbi:MAG: LacI family DNA-binding transcriptional regulator [Anaerolineaceae bacterium]|nr:LacI family DNA-binding transcriptional regulator [Anaerolineaceae bacterium]